MPEANETYLSLSADKIVATIDALYRRINERFPESGLRRICEDLQQIAHRAQVRATWIAKPIRSLRVTCALFVGLILAGFISVLSRFQLANKSYDVVQFIQALEAGINDVVLIGAGVFFLLTLETRIKRTRALRAMDELRSLAHIIDMHQLTKDPERVSPRSRRTISSPAMTFDAYQLSRYLDYCSEMLSLVGKLAALYVQNFNDTVALSAVNEIESLTNGLSRKIWQKIMILHSLK